MLGEIGENVSQKAHWLKASREKALCRISADRVHRQKVLVQETAEKDR